MYLNCIHINILLSTLSDNLCHSSIGRNCLFLSYKCMCIYNYLKLKSLK